MREIILPVAQSTSATMEVDEAQTPDDEDVIGCLPRLLAVAHKEEVERIIASIPSVAVEGKEHELEGALERYQKLLDLYQEQPSLLDVSIPSLLSSLLALVHLPNGERKTLDRQSAIAMQFAYHLTKVRGDKVMVRLLPHDVHYLAPLINCLEAYTNTVGGDMAERMMLLLWLTIVAKNPFDLRRFDGASEEGATLRRIFAIALPYLEYAASLLVAECLSRLDGHPHLANTLQRIAQTIDTAVEETKSAPTAEGTVGLDRLLSDRIVGPLVLLLAIMKKVDRTLLLPHASLIHEMIKRFLPLRGSDAFLAKKCVVKAVQRLGLIMLRPRLAAWRYTRGKRRLEENLKSTVEEGGTGEESPRGGKKRRGGRRREEEEMEEEGGDGLGEGATVMGWIVDCLLRALSDPDTDVRWSAAKGLGRICSRIPKDMVSMVVQSILQQQFHRFSGNASWHGGCLCLAELSRRGCLLPSFLPQAFAVVRSALFFQEPTGRFAIGSNVRDAACYVVWAWARAYEAIELAGHVEEIASALMCVALFDREVSIRRAASAAFQENVGRQRTFPDGISLLTMVDYFAVGNRKRCYTELAVQVAAFPKYRRHLIDHLIEDKIVHWDEAIREATAKCLGLLVESDPEYLKEKLVGHILERTNTANVLDRHGFVLAAAHIYAGLRRIWVTVDDGVEAHLSSLPSLLSRPMPSMNGRAREVTQRANALVIETLASAQLPLNREQVGEWLGVVETLVADDKEALSTLAAECAVPFFTHYVNASSEWTTQAQSTFASKMLSTRREGERTGSCLLSALLPSSSIDNSLVDALTTVVHNRTDIDRLWARGREAAARAVTTVGLSGGERTRRAVGLLVMGTDDYTTDKRGDIGRTVREESMRGLATLANHKLLQEEELEEAIQRMVQQSAEKIAKTRIVACECLMSMLSAGGLNQLSYASLLRSVYRDPKLFQQDGVLVSLSPLFSSPILRPFLLRALILSAGGVSEGTTRHATQSLMNYLKTLHDESDEQSFVGLLSEMVSDSLLRISLSALRVLPRLLLHIPIIEQRPDKCAALSRIIASLVKIIQKSLNPTRCRLALDTFSTLLSLPTDTTVWKTACESCIRALDSSMPAVRRAAAEALYEGLCVGGDIDEEALQILAETPWQDTEDVEGLKRASRLVEERLMGGEAMEVL